MNHLLERFHPRFGPSCRPSHPRHPCRQPESSCRGPRVLAPASRGWWALLYGILCQMPPAWAEDPACPYLRMHSAGAGLVAAVNAAIPADIPVPTAAGIDCGASRLPGSRNELIGMLPEPHRRLIDECARGRAAVKRRIEGFDLLSLIEESPDETSNTTTIREFFDARAVDVAVGRALSDGPYPITFDWAVVLDRDSHTLYSFILNCSD